MYSLTIRTGEYDLIYRYAEIQNVKKVWTYSVDDVANSMSYDVASYKKRNVIHRSNVYEPSVEFIDGRKLYSNYYGHYSLFKTDEFRETITDGFRHSINNYPAVIYNNGTQEWYYRGVLHRRCLPAVEYPNGDKEYWCNGFRHRYGGPAVIIGDKQYWFEDGEFIKCIV